MNTQVDNKQSSCTQPGAARQNAAEATPEGNRVARRFALLRERAKAGMCMWDARMRNALAEPEQGAATAEYAVVLVAATGFAALLMTILKSDTVKTMLLNIIKQALQLG